MCSRNICVYYRPVRVVSYNSYLCRRGSLEKLRPKILMPASPAQADPWHWVRGREGDSPFSIIKPRVDEESHVKFSVYYALVIEALIEASLDESSIFQGIMCYAYISQ